MSIELPRLPQALAALLCAGLSGACAISPAAEAPKTPSVFAEPAAAPGAEPVLYARDGSVVSLADGPREAAGERAALARREVGTAESGRMYLLELYQQVIDERDGLAREVVALRADIDALRNTNAQAQERAVAMEQRLQTLEAEQVRMQAQNLELAGRLTTAQIRRLQAERLLLEHKLAEQRAREAAQLAAAPATPAQEKRP